MRWLFSKRRSKESQLFFRGCIVDIYTPRRVYCQGDRAGMVGSRREYSYHCPSCLFRWAFATQLRQERYQDVQTIATPIRAGHASRNMGQAQGRWIGTGLKSSHSGYQSSRSPDHRRESAGSALRGSSNPSCIRFAFVVNTTSGPRQTTVSTTASHDAPSRLVTATTSPRATASGLSVAIRAPHDPHFRLVGLPCQITSCDCGSGWVLNASWDDRLDSAMTRPVARPTWKVIRLLTPAIAVWIRGKSVDPRVWRVVAHFKLGGPPSGCNELSRRGAAPR